MLVLDDETIIADTLAAILSLHGYESAAVYRGEDAVERSRSFRPELVIADVVMPGMNGIEAAIAIRKMLPGCKILLFSGQAATADLLQEARRSGHDFDILSKPVHPDELLAKIS
ncbi:MAG TPA: response regulator [Terriglobales bacterium]|nr:response regulator [Terriglobales bacterium]